MGKIILVILSLMPISIASAKLVQILHTNDTHAYLDGATHDRSRGGAARLKSLIDYYKEKMASEGVSTVVFDAGDFTEGNAYYMADRARMSFKVHSEIGYDFTALGNHDYLMGSSELEKILSDVDLNFSFLCANLEVRNKSKFRNVFEKIKPYKEFEIDGFKFGVIGLTTNEIFYTWRFDAGKITSPYFALSKYESILKNRKNDFIIALTHVGLSKDIQLARGSKNLDLIIGGHSHTALLKPVNVISSSSKDVPIVQAGMHTEYLGRLIIDVQKGYPLRIVSYELVPTKYEAYDEKVKSMVDLADQELFDLYGKEWLEGKVGVSDLKPNDPEGSRKWAYFITDLLRDRTGADVAIHTPPMNGEQYPVGILTRRDVMNSIPRVFDLDDKYGWSMYTTKIRGAWLKFVFEALALFGQPLTFSGVEVEYVKLPIGFRVRKLLINGQKISPYKLYTVAFTEGIVRGAEGVSPYTLNLLKMPKKTDIKIWQAIEDELKKSDAFTPNKLKYPFHQYLENKSETIEDKFVKN